MGDRFVFPQGIDDETPISSGTSSIQAGGSGRFTVLAGRFELLSESLICVSGHTLHTHSTLERQITGQIWTYRQTDEGHNLQSKVRGSRREV